MATIEITVYFRVRPAWRYAACRLTYRLGARWAARHLLGGLWGEMSWNGGKTWESIGSLVGRDTIRIAKLIPRW